MLLRGMVDANRLLVAILRVELVMWQLGARRVTLSSGLFSLGRNSLWGGGGGGGGGGGMACRAAFSERSQWS